MAQVPGRRSDGRRQRSVRVHLSLFLPLLAAVFTAALHPRSGALSFEDRVKAQEAIERVYYSHQIGATRPFEQAVPRQVLENKVRRYLKESVALERFWNTPVTAAMLRAELERMTSQTRMPGRLREIFAALGDDPVLIQECLARPALVNRLTRNFFTSDEAIHARARREAETVHEGLSSGRIDPHAEHPNRTLRRRELRDLENMGGRAEPAVGIPARPGELGPLLEERDRFVTHVVVRKEAGGAWVASYAFPKRSWEEWWEEVEAHLDENSVEAVASGADAQPWPEVGPDGSRVPGEFSPNAMATGGDVPASACVSDDVWENGSLDDFPDRRWRHTAIWTGSVMVVWGGLVTSSFTGPVFLNTGGRYDPATDTWTGVSTINAPQGRSGHTAVWTGSRMVVWGGGIPTGGRYDPATDTWTPITTTDAPTASGSYGGVWTGGLVVVWSGSERIGGRYDPETDTWMPVSTTNAPSARWDQSTVWTGNLMVIWGGRAPSVPGDNDLATGGRYDPVTDTWTPTSTTNAPMGRYRHTAVWTGSRMIVWGGRAIVSNQVTHQDTGGMYDPVTDTWKPTTTVNAPSGRWHHSAVWSGELMLVWGGAGPDSSGLVGLLTTGGRYDPAADTWTPTSTTNAPSGRSEQSAIWTGQHMIIWGGMVGTALIEVIIHLDTGGRYDPLTDTWSPTSRGDAPEARSDHTAVWTGSLMVVWGGQFLDPAYDAHFPLATGGRYDPATDSWTPTSTTEAPAPRGGHTAVWTGHEMIVWGEPVEGGRYDPVADTWAPTSTIGAPAPRFLHTAVWTGSRMIVWGGLDGVTRFKTGGLYEPATDTWAPMSETNPPSGGLLHTAVWTGDLMIVWGGGSGNGVVATGGRYDPVTDSWTSTSMTDAPSARWLHTAVWMGREMIVWGGGGHDGTDLATGGRYEPTTDTWMPISTTDVPAGRRSHSAVWTGSVMVVWGGENQSGPYAPLVNTGGRYDPASDTWTATTTGNAPMARSQHTGVWTGDLMIVWGGEDALNTRTGGAYCACPSAVYYLDADCDGHGDPAVWVRSCSRPAGYVTDGSDCEDSAGDVWAVPQEVRDLLFVDDRTLAWVAPADPGATSVVYDLIRAPDPSDLVSGAICIVSDAAVETAEDSAPPLQGEAFFYLARAENNCPDGQGSLGTDSSGRPRLARSCP